MNETTKQLIEQLNDKSSKRRRSAAKKLRKLKDITAGPELSSALIKEIRDKRTWETQYQIIMALGESGHIECLPFLLQISVQEFEAKMIYLAIGDAIGRLTYIKNGSISNALELLKKKGQNPFLIDGLVRAIAMLKLTPSEDDIEQILNYGNEQRNDDNTRFWVASAAAGWSGKKVEDFLIKTAESGSPQARKAAEAALKKIYPKWDIL